MAAKWNFPSNNFGTITGIGEAGIETFKGNPFASLAKEICQNSIDARLDKNKPVRVEFSLIKRKTSDFPKFDKLFAALNQCREFWENQKSKETVKFFDTAIKTAKGTYIPVMRISDFNTTGLTGSDEDYNTPWQNLVKASGVSDKDGSAGGSFGIGKSAPFACSDLRTVFYATYDKDGKTASQGIARLVSFKEKGLFGADKDSVTTGIGYYGNDKKNSPIRECISLDDSYKRTEYGTDIYIIGLTSKSDWETEMIKSVLENFLLSIYFDALIVKINNSVISKKTLPDMIEKYKADADTAYNYYQVLTSESTENTSHEFENLGEIDLGILIKAGFHRRVMVCRSNGMKIFDQKNISGTILFAGICILKDDQINSFFREMENPQHDAWEPERHSSPKLAKTKKQEFTRFIRETVISLGKRTTIDEIDAEGAGEYIADIINNDTENEKRQENISDEIKSISVELETSKSTQTGFENVDMGEAYKYDDSIGDEDGVGSGGFGAKDYGDDKANVNSGDGIGSGEGDGSGTHGEGDNPYMTGIDNPESVNPIKRRFEIRLMKIRMFLADSHNGVYRLIFTPQKSAGKGYLSLKMSCEQNSIDINIISARESGTGRLLECSGNRIYLDNIQMQMRNQIEFRINYKSKCSMEVNLYGYKG